MQLIEINKKRYRKHLNIIIVSFIASLLILSLLFGTLFISMFSTVADTSTVVSYSTADSVVVSVTEPVAKAVAETLAESEISTKGAEQESNFKYNLLGVILALLANAAMMHSLRKHEFFTEVYYVWQVKQLQNLIYRKINKIKAAGKAGDENALIILAFYYQSQIQVYELDDNTITLSSIKIKQNEVTESIAELGLTVGSEEFNKELIKLY